MKRLFTLLLVSLSLVFASCNLNIEVPDRYPNAQYYPTNQYYPSFNTNCGCGEIVSIVYIPSTNGYSGGIADITLRNLCPPYNTNTFNLSTAVLGNQVNNGYICLGTTW